MAENVTETKNDDKSISDMIRDKILYTLQIYPKLSPSMLQVGIGTSVSSKIWRPILNELISNGTVREYSERSPRNQSHRILELVQPAPSAQ